MPTLGRSNSKILTEFDRENHVLLSMHTAVSRLFVDLLAAANLQVLSVDGRLKERASLEEKLARPGKQYSVLEDVTDVLGFRIVTYFEDDVDRVADLVGSEFKLVPEHCVDRRATLEPDRFGYKSLHYVCELSDLRKQLRENAAYRDRKFEVQIRSILQHAWAEIEHDLGYKGGITIPSELKRQLSRVAGLLEIADRDFREVRDKSKEYRTQILKKLEQNRASEIELNADSYSAFISSSPLVARLEEFIEGEIGATIVPEEDNSLVIGMLKSAGINTIGALQSLLEANADVLRRYAAKVFDRVSPLTVAVAVSVFHLPQILLLRQGGARALENLYEEHLNLGENAKLIAEANAAHLEEVEKEMLDSLVSINA